MILLTVIALFLAPNPCGAAPPGSDNGAATTPPSSESSATQGDVIHKDIDMHTVASIKINLSVENGTAKDFMSAIGNALAPTPISIQVRLAKRFTASLKVSQMSVEDILRGIAGFSHCELYILHDQFLIAPESALRPDEKAELDRGTSNNIPSSLREPSSPQK